MTSWPRGVKVSRYVMSDLNYISAYLPEIPHRKMKVEVTVLGARYN